MLVAAPLPQTPRLRLRPFGAQVLRRERVISLIRPGNARSVAVAEAIGEKPHGSVDLMGGQALVYEARR